MIYIYRQVGGYTRHFRKSIPVSKGITTCGYYVSRYPSGTGTLRRVPGYFNTHGMPYTSQSKKKARVDTTDATDNDSSDDHHLTIDEVNERIHCESLKLFIS